MRRPTAIALLLVLLTTFAAPAAMARSTQPTPACCRAGGRHHCSAMVPTNGETQLRDGCPYSKPLVFSVSAAPLANVVITAPETHPFLHEFYPELFAPEGEQPHPERAPPTARK